MKLVSVSITAFGKLKNVAFNFADGVNILQQANGFGKSTLGAFVRAMLYGLNYGYKLVDGNRTNDVTKYQPWDATGKFGGSMEIAHEGKTYRIERFFGATAKSESCIVTDTSTGRQLNIPNPGEHFLGLTVDSFDRCTYLPQEYVAIVPNENFDAKLANLVEDSALDYDKLQDKLRAYKKTLRYERGIGGEIPTLENEIFQLKGKLASAQNQVAERKRMGEQLVQIEQSLEQIAKEETALQAKVDQLQQSLYQAQPSPADMELARKIDDVELKIASVPQSITQDYAKVEQLQGQLKSLDKKRNVNNQRKKLFTISFAVALLLAVVLVVLKQYIPSGIVGAVAIACGVLAFANNGKQDVAQIEEIGANIQQIVAKYLSPTGKTLEEMYNQLWNYHNDYQTNLTVRKALGKRPVMQTNQGTISAELNQTKMRLQALVDRKQSLTRSAVELQLRLKQPTASLVDIADEIAEKEQLLAEAKRKYQVATQTSELLAEAKLSLSSAYVPELCAKTQNLLNAVTQGNYKVVTDRNFAI
ncbi:MAG: hypothetical protein IJB95_04380, partial [Clostridia bacterium]|nr:hypothetical protein [Clostridia bacterium]